MLAFLRRRRDGGARALGEAVTGIPAAPRRAVVPTVPEARVPDPGRVELGFRDGTRVDLVGEQAHALVELADLMCRHDRAVAEATPSTG